MQNAEAVIKLYSFGILILVEKKHIFDIMQPQQRNGVLLNRMVFSAVESSAVNASG